MPTTCEGTHKPYVDLHRLWRQKEFQPDIVTIALGTNDSQPKVAKMRITSQRTSKKILSLYATNSLIYLQNLAFISVFLSLLYPMSTLATPTQVLLNEIIPIIKKVAEDKDTETIDLYTPLIR